ncbi:Pentatricopeptide repeat-containing protein At3g57430, chloroplastic [Linum perenne]
MASISARYSRLLSQCTAAKSLAPALEVHGHLIKFGLQLDIKLRNLVVNVYSKCRAFGYARKVIDEIPEPDLVAWSALISGYSQNGYGEEAIRTFKEMHSLGIKCNEFAFPSVFKACTLTDDLRLGRQVHGNVVAAGFENDEFVLNSMVVLYAKCGEILDSRRVFEAIPCMTVVSWNALLSSYVQRDSFGEALELFQDMILTTQIRPNEFSLSTMINACTGLEDSGQGRRIHGFLIKLGYDLDLFSNNALVDMYAKMGYLEDAVSVFDGIAKPDIVSWNAVIAGCSLNGEDVEAVSLFPLLYKNGVGFNQTTLSTVLKSTASLQASHVCRQMHTLALKSGFESDSYVVNSLVDAYGKCEQIKDALSVFRESPTLDLLAFTSMITAYSQDGQGEEAFRLYLDMQSLSIKPDAFVFSALLNACGNSLVHTYAKCGCIDDTERAFHEISERSIVSWSALIGGMAQHGHRRQALQLFDQMLKDGVAPNHITLVNVLSACNHTGLVDDAKRYLSSMEELFGITPTQEHYACMIDILGRAGKLDEAMELVNTMPYEANASVWGALLGAARMHKNVDLGRKAAEMLLVLEPEKSGTHILLANIYSSAGMWDGAAKIRKYMKDSKVKKEPGMSWMEIKDEVHTFTVGDRSHPRSMEIYAKLEDLSEPLKKAGYVPMVETELHDVEPSEKAKLLYHHSEKLAVAFGLIATPSGAPIRVKKNLRVCLDCHTALKLISKISSREIIVRDINRFHHFRDGLCSCEDYW